MSNNEEQSKEIKLENLEKPLTEQELKETTGGAAENGTRPPNAQLTPEQLAQRAKPVKSYAPTGRNRGGN